MDKYPPGFIYYRLRSIVNKNFKKLLYIRQRIHNFYSIHIYINENNEYIRCFINLINNIEYLLHDINKIKFINIINKKVLTYILYNYTQINDIINIIYTIYKKVYNIIDYSL